MQPSAVGDVGGVRRVRADVQEPPLNVDDWWRRGEGGVAADQVCCHSRLRTVIMVTRTVSVVFPTILFPEAWEGAGEGGENRQAEAQGSWS